jgi:hypothetical protein
MSPTLLILSICLYLMSLVASLLIGMVSKRFSPTAIRIPILIHFGLLIIALLLYFLEVSLHHSLMIITFCSGLLLSVWALRKKEHHLLFKTYFGLYLLSIILFISSPGKLFYLISGNIHQYKAEKKIDLQENYFLIEQRSMFTVPSDSTPYKIVKQSGFYKKTLLRDILVEDEIDEGRMILANEDTIVIELTFKEIGKKRLGFKGKLSKNSIYKKQK